MQRLTGPVRVRSAVSKPNNYRSGGCLFGLWDYEITIIPTMYLSSFVSFLKECIRVYLTFDEAFQTTF